MSKGAVGIRELGRERDGMEEANDALDGDERSLLHGVRMSLT